MTLTTTTKIGDTVITSSRCWDYDSVRETCIRHQFYTCGTCSAYNSMLHFVDDNEPTLESLYAVAIDIFAHSGSELEGLTAEDIMSILEREAVRTWFETEIEIDEDLIDEELAAEAAAEIEDTEDTTTTKEDKPMFANATINRAYEIINAQKARSAWKQGVRAYAWDMLEQLDDAIAGGWFDAEDLAARKVLSKHLLNGADDWHQASWGGSWLCYDGEIAERLCSPSELKKTRNGQRRPNRWEEWLDVQTRALEQAACQVVNACLQAAEELAPAVEDVAEDVTVEEAEPCAQPQADAYKVRCITPDGVKVVLFRADWEKAHDYCSANGWKLLDYGTLEMIEDAGDLPEEHSAGRITYEHLQALALANYSKGGDAIFECWDRNTFDEYVEQFGPITERGALHMFAQDLELENEQDEFVKWASGEPEGGRDAQELEDEDPAPECCDDDGPCPFDDPDWDEDFGEYIPSASAGDYGPSNPWDAPGMRVSDFISGVSPF